MKRAIPILLALVIAGCTTNSAIFELYSEKPIAVNCAHRAIENTEGISKAWLENHAIRFKGYGFSGELYHGGKGEPFTTYGLEIQSNPIIGEGVKTIADKITESINGKCTN
ncbi:hypothetical protein SAMN03080615_02759 [Amphritea atlantica]|uniref:Lipoprotein n=1 Tax=Amphritea atlantica TaxID=355243 RepID=A0A1H9IYL4_9GAMM|nr:hypothetical protein [Amphritea atlantica]SEQ79609.1 hypothetical protein SAMN03080615_02759 [Amphritea atlantica]